LTSQPIALQFRKAEAADPHHPLLMFQNSSAQNHFLDFDPTPRKWQKKNL
jgi:hypothetical protein